MIGKCLFQVDYGVGVVEEVVVVKVIVWIGDRCVGKVGYF